MAVPAKPSWWSVFPGRGMLKTSPPLVAETTLNASTPGGQKGMTATDKDKAEKWAWFQLLSTLASRFDVCDWGTDPPYPLDRYWEMLASAYYRIMEIGASGAERQEEAIVPIAWIKSVQRELERVADPSDEGINLISSSSCAVIRPRGGLFAPMVAGHGLTFFPGLENETSGGLSGGFVGGSLEEFQRQHGWLASVWNSPT